MNKNQLREIVENIKESADELIQKGKDNLDLVEKGQLLGYAEALTIIKDAISEDNAAVVGLDFDIDAEYLY